MPRLTFARIGIQLRIKCLFGDAEVSHTHGHDAVGAPDKEVSGAMIGHDLERSRAARGMKLFCSVVLEG